MGKSKRLGATDLTMAMWLSMVGAAVDTMVAAGMEARFIHLFLDRLHSAADHVLRDKAADLIHEMLEVVRMAVPAND